MSEETTGDSQPSERSQQPADWKVFHGDRDRHDGLKELPDPPPWRFSRDAVTLELPEGLDLDAERDRARPFLPNSPIVIAVNAALYLRRPLLLTGEPGTGKTTLISKVAYELQLGPVIRWSISSRSTVRGGVYEYDAVGRLQAAKEGEPPVEDYLILGPLGTALMATTWPLPLLIDEIDKSDLDFANDLLNVIEEGAYEIPELRRLGGDKQIVRDSLGNEVAIEGGLISCQQFPFVVMTSNAEREFPAPFLRRCVRLHIKPPTSAELGNIVKSHLKEYSKTLDEDAIESLINDFDRRRKESQLVSTDQLLNAIFLTVVVPDRERSFDKEELDELYKNLLHPLSGPLS